MTATSSAGRFPAPGQADTSRRAWWNAQETMPARIEKCYRYAMAAGEYGVTGDELERGCSILHQSMGSILLELRHAGLLVERPITRPTKTGQLARVYVAVPFGQHRPTPFVERVSLREAAKAIVAAADAKDAARLRDAIVGLRAALEDGR